MISVPAGASNSGMQRCELVSGGKKKINKKTYSRFRVPFEQGNGNGEMTQRNGKLPLIKSDNGDAYEGEWLNGKQHGHGIYTWANGSR